MSRLFSQNTKKVTPYVPGAQPKDKTYIKLNTNEFPYPPAPAVEQLLRTRSVDDLRLYPDPTSTALRQAMADVYGLSSDQVFAGCGSDEILAFAFMAFFDAGDPVYFADITYGFYSVYADLFNLEAKKIPLKDDFTLDCSDYFGLDSGMFIANPNAPTGICLTPDDIETILKTNPNQLVVVDEAYVDFSENNTCIPLIETYDNLLVVQTFSKSRALAGVRLGFAFGNPQLLDGLERMKFSFNPFNLDRLATDVGIASLNDWEYLSTTVINVVETRESTTKGLEALGFSVLPSQTNFVFATHPQLSAKDLYAYLGENGILVRYFPAPRTANYLRITIGTEEDMETFLAVVATYQKERM